MSQWIQRKFISLLSPRLQKFKTKDNNLFNFSCPICGDSHKNKQKTRGYIYLGKKGSYVFHCHNCGSHASFTNFLKQQDQALYLDYVKEKMIDDGTFKQNEESEVQSFVNKMKPPLFMKTKYFENCKKISALSHDHKAKKYIDARQIPNEYHYKIFYVEDFNQWVNEIIPDKIKTNIKQDRIVIPLLDKDQNVIGFQGRSLLKDDPKKYITIMLSDEFPKIYGLDTVDLDKEIIVFEGPIDSMFIENSIASCGGDITSEISNLTSFNKDNIIIVYDNEPRNKHTVSKMEKAIKNGFKVCILDDKNIKEGEDINDMILRGLEPEIIRNSIIENSYNGLEATFKLAVWKKV